MKTFLLLLILPISYAGRVLFVSPTPKSHKGSMMGMMKAMAARGHHVALFAELKDDSDIKLPSNVHDRQSYDLWGGFAFTNDTVIQELQWKSVMWPITMAIPAAMSVKIGKYFLTQHRKEFDALVHDDWDVMLVDNLFSTAGVALVGASKVPHLLMATSLLENNHYSIRGYSTPPHTAAPFFAIGVTWDHRRFMDRVTNTLHDLQFEIVNALIVPFYWNPVIRLVAPAFSLAEFYRSGSGGLVEYPDRIDWPKPTNTREFLPTSVDCFAKSTAPAPLPDDLESFVADPKSKGTIMVAFGTMIDWSTAPVNIRDALLNAFLRFPDYRIIWSYRGTPPANVPSHIKFLAWIPQPSLLADPRTKLFISHGGLKSFKETLCAAVPVLYLPLFAEQLRNSLLAKKWHYGDTLDKMSMTMADVEAKTRRILERNDEFRSAATRCRDMWNDRIVPAPVEAAHRVELVMKHKGLPEQMRNRAAKLSAIVYYNLDVIATFVTLISFLLYGAVNILSSFCRK